MGFCASCIPGDDCDAEGFGAVLYVPGPRPGEDRIRVHPRLICSVGDVGDASGGACDVMWQARRACNVRSSGLCLVLYNLGIL